MSRNILQENPGGVVLSTDDYFRRDGFYHYDPSELAEAHEWNHNRGIAIVIDIGVFCP